MPCKESGEFPVVWVHESDEYARVDLGQPIMEFRLTYQGPLFANRGPDDKRQSRLKHMQDIRRLFHAQLDELWKVDSRLIPFWHAKDIPVRERDSDAVKVYSTYFDAIGAKYHSGGINWVPLIREDWGSVCSLNILFLRHEPKGGIIQSGDLDNRINTLFDALRMPDESQIPDDVHPQNEPNPFFCLLSNDKLIAEFRVTADRLLVPNPKPDADVYLVIEVRTFIADHEKAKWILGANVHA